MLLETVNYISMKTTINYFSRVLCALLLCVGIVVASCEEISVDNAENTEQSEGNTEQGGNENTDSNGEEGNDNEDDEDIGGSESDGENENDGYENIDDKENDSQEGLVIQTDAASIAITRITGTTVTFSGHLDVPTSDVPFSLIEFYYSEADTFNMGSANSLLISSFDSAKNFCIPLNLKYNTRYKCCFISRVKSEVQYSKEMEFSTGEVIPQILYVSPTTGPESNTILMGSVSGFSDAEKGIISFYIVWMNKEYKSSLEDPSYLKMLLDYYDHDYWHLSISSDNTFIKSFLMDYDTKYCYRLGVYSDGKYTWGDIQEFTTAKYPSNHQGLNSGAAIDLSSYGSANCYIISNPGLYKFKAVKGKSDIQIDNIAYVEILWESFGTSVCPEWNDLISGGCYEDGYIVFKTNDMYKEGNALIAAKDAEGDVLWSWHLWLTDQPKECVYPDNIGIVMDRNLGATSATRYDVSSLGLLYQWGRKDPFCGSSSIKSDINAKLTALWYYEYRDNVIGTIEYATAHPKTFIAPMYFRTGLDDWHYKNNNTRWTSDGIYYDPCPAG